MKVLRVFFALVFGGGILAGVGAAVLDGDNRIVPLLIGIVAFWLALKYLMSRPSQPKKWRYKGPVTKADLARMRREYDEDRRRLALATHQTDVTGEQASYFDSYGHKRNAHTNDRMYMNRNDTPNGDVFAGWLGTEIQYDGGPAYMDEGGNFWREE